MIKLKRGVSNIIYAVLLIGIILVSFLIVYNVVNLSLKQKTSEVSSGFDRILEMFSFSSSKNESAADSGANLNSLAGNIVLDSGESCYIELKINEEKRGDIYNEYGEAVSQDIEFSLAGSENLFGDYGSLVSYYYEEMPSSYILRTYDGEEREIGNFSLESGRFIFFDNFADAENPGGVLELNESVISAIIPYDSRIDGIKIEYNNTLTDINVNVHDFNCERTCKIENESLTEDENCCSGLVKSELQDSIYRCTICGDGICSEYENEYSCYKDCKVNFTCPENYVKEEFGCEVIEEPIGSCMNLSVQNKTYALVNDIFGEGSGDCLKITASNVTLDCRGHSITGDISGAGIYSNQLGTIIKNCKISMGIENCQLYCSGYNSKGIFLENADNSQILNNELNGNYIGGGWKSEGQWNGLHVKNSKNVLIQNNSAGGNVMHGIWLEKSSNNILKRNTASWNGYTGIYIAESSGNLIEENRAENNNFDGINLDWQSNNNNLNNNYACWNAKTKIYKDYSCSGSSGNSGYVNKFGSVQYCNNNGPSYQSCS